MSGFLSLPVPCLRLWSGAGATHGAGRALQSRGVYPSTMHRPLAGYGFTVPRLLRRLAALLLLAGVCGGLAPGLPAPERALDHLQGDRRRPAAGPAATDSVHVFEVERLAQGVYAAVVVDRPDAYAFANSLFVIGESGVLVVDTQQSPRAARELIRRIRQMTPLPVQWVVNTHWHGDHVYGNVAYRDAFPEARFVAHPATAGRVDGEGRVRLSEELESLPASIAEREGWLRDEQLPDGRALTPSLREQIGYSLRLRRTYLAELSALGLVPPEGWITSRRQIDLGGRTVDLIPVGPAHTEGDVIVSVSGVVAVGDLLEEGLPWVAGAPSLQGWAVALECVQAEGGRVLLPSHGGIQRDATLLDGTRALFDDVLRLGQARVAGAAAEPVVDVGVHRDRFGAWGVAGTAFDRWWEAALDQAVAQGRASRGSR